jgi:hypothetical protein
MVVLLILGIGVSVYFDIRLLPFWALPGFFVILALIFHRPSPILICTILAYASLAGVTGLLYSRRPLPPAGIPLAGEEQNAPVSGETSLLVEIKSRMQFEMSPESARRILDLTLRSEEDPIRFDLSLVSEGEPGNNDTPPLIYFAPMPYRINGEERSVEFFLGEGPPNPLNLEIILAASFSGRLRAEALYLREDREGKTYVERQVRETPITR